jgi:hypothetical protein
VNERAIAVASGLAEGLTIRAVAERTSIPRATVGRIARQPEVKARASAERLLAGAPPERVKPPPVPVVERVRQHRERQREAPTIAKQRSTGGSDGRILGVITGALQGSAQVTVFGARHTLADETEEAWLIRRAKEREDSASLPSIANATVLTATSRLGFDPLDIHDIARVLNLIESEVALDEHEIRMRLASTQPGATLSLVAECAA